MVHDPLRSSGPPSGQSPDASGEGAERVAKALARAGVASRREVERLIEAGRVALNGQVLTTPAVKVEPGDILTVDGEVVNEAEPARLFRYHKPVGLVTTHNDPQGRPTVFESLPEGLPRLISVGRLDLNTEGLLLLTNDGGLARALELPSTAIVRRYRARAHGRITQEKLDKLKDGVTVEGVKYGAIDAKLDKAREGEQGANVWITLTLHEGKNREVRRVLESLGLKVNRLLRLSYGPFALGTLDVGQIEEVGPRVIREQLAEHIDPANLPTGERPQFLAKNKPSAAALRRAESAEGHQTRANVRMGVAEPEEKKTYKAGWAKPKITAKPHAKRPKPKAGPAVLEARPGAARRIAEARASGGGKYYAPKSDGPRSSASRSGPAKGDAPRSGPSKSGASRPDAPRSAPARADRPRPDARSDAPRSGAPKSRGPRSEASRSEAPRSGTPGSGAHRTGPAKAGAPRKGPARSGPPRSGAPSSGAPRPAGGGRPAGGPKRRG